MKKNILTILLMHNFLFAFDNTDIAKAIKEIALRENIDQRILYTIAKIESNFKPFAICMTTSKENALQFKQIQNPNIKIIASEYKYNKNKWIISFYPKNLLYAKALATAFKKQNFSFDVGLTQINTTNFKLEEIDYIFDPKYNLLKSSKVLKSCLKMKKDIKKTIECYNYGTKHRNSYPYYTKFKKAFSKSFGI